MTETLKLHKILSTSYSVVLLYASALSIACLPECEAPFAARVADV